MGRKRPESSRVCFVADNSRGPANGSNGSAMGLLARCKSMEGLLEGTFRILESYHQIKRDDSFIFFHMAGC